MLIPIYGHSTVITHLAVGLSVLAVLQGVPPGSELWGGSALLGRLLLGRACLALSDSRLPQLIHPLLPLIEALLFEILDVHAYEPAFNWR